MEYQVIKNVLHKITEVLKKLQKNNSETVTNENDREIPRKRCISPEERQTIIDNLIFNKTA